MDKEPAPQRSENNGFETDAIHSEKTLTDSRIPLPFSMWWPFGIGAFTGFVLRLIFSGSMIGAFTGIGLRLIFSGEPGGRFSAMGPAFILFAPIVAGAVTVYVAEAKQRRTWLYYLLASMLASSLFVLGTFIILIEGLICVLLVLPLFTMLGAIGGLIMGAICRATKWRSGAVYSIAALPLLVSIVPTSAIDNQRIGILERMIVIEASPEKIWQQIHNANDIRADEVGHAWMYRIGVPLPLAGTTHLTREGHVRKVTMGKSVHFEQVATEWQENRHVRWIYRFDETSFPPGALDDHVKIGGHYFDLLDTEYTLVPRTENATELKITMRYRVSTQFNWYADRVAMALIGNFEEVILDFYRRRSVNAS